MEAEATPTTGADAGTGSAPDYDAIFSGASPESVLAGGEKPASETPETPEQPAAETPTETAKPEAEPAKVEAKEPDQTAEQDAEPLPQKIEDLLKAVRQANPKLAQELNRIVREDHFKLHGPTGFLSTFQGGVEEAQEYKTIAPTVEDLRTMAEYSQRFDGLERAHASNPDALVDVLVGDPSVAEDNRRFANFARALEPALRQRHPERYALVAKGFNENFWGNVISYVDERGTPEQAELFRTVGQQLLGGPMQAQRAPAVGQPQPFQAEQQQFQQERQAWEAQKREAFFQDVNRQVVPAVRGEVAKYLAEKASTLPDDIRDELAGTITSQIFNEINRNPMVASEVRSMIEGGDLSQDHMRQMLDRALVRARAYLPTKSAPEIRRWSERLRKLQGGNGKATSPGVTGQTKDVGAGSPTVGGPVGAPKGFPPGWNAMKPQQRADALSSQVNWAAMGEDADEIFMAVCAGAADPSKLVLKGK